MIRSAARPSVAGDIPIADCAEFGPRTRSGFPERIRPEHLGHGKGLSPAIDKRIRPRPAATRSAVPPIWRDGPSTNRQALECLRRTIIRVLLSMTKNAGGSPLGWHSPSRCKPWNTRPNGALRLWRVLRAEFERQYGLDRDAGEATDKLHELI